MVQLNINIGPLSFCSAKIVTAEQKWLKSEVHHKLSFKLKKIINIRAYCNNFFFFFL